MPDPEYICATAAKTIGGSSFKTTMSCRVSPTNQSFHGWSVLLFVPWMWWGAWWQM